MITFTVILQLSYSVPKQANGVDESLWMIGNNTERIRS